ncbi:hypothetical protein ACS8E3_02650 [Psychrobacter sp. 2Y5]|uniref:hypothetical protein n=1 Tax=unclassified Psychrobacter TaxID=196806 RepID=UPI003F454D77
MTDVDNKKQNVSQSAQDLGNCEKLSDVELIAIIEARIDDEQLPVRVTLDDL